MKIAYLCTDFGIPIHGNKGASIHVREMSAALAALGHEVRIYSPRAGKVDGDMGATFGVPVCELAPERHQRRVYRLLRDDPDVGGAVAAEVRVLMYADSLRHRALAELRAFRPHVIYERLSLFGTAGIALARELDVPLILEVNAPLSEEHVTHRDLAYKTAARELEREVLHTADALVAVSEELKRWLLGEGVSPGHIRVLPNGVDADRFRAGLRERDAVRRRLGLEGRPVVGFVGTLKAWHGTETLLRAVARLHRRGGRQHLLIVGDGPERQELEELAAREGIAELVTFTGAIPHNQAPGYIAAMDVAVAPYAHAAGFYFSPLKLYEYMATARPVVAAGVGQILSLLTHGETGLLYPPGDVESLADAIGCLLADPALAAQLGASGQRHVRSHHTWERNARSVVALAESLVESRASNPRKAQYAVMPNRPEALSR